MVSGGRGLPIARSPRSRRTKSDNPFPTILRSLFGLGINYLIRSPPKQGSALSDQPFCLSLRQPLNSILPFILFIACHKGPRVDTLCGMIFLHWQLLKPQLYRYHDCQRLFSPSLLRRLSRVVGDCCHRFSPACFP